MADPKIFSYQMAYEIWISHREIEVGEKLLADIQETMKHPGETPVDRSGRRGFQLGVPSGSGHRLLDLEPSLAQIIIEQNIALQRARLIDLADKVREELGTPPAGRGVASEQMAALIRAMEEAKEAYAPDRNSDFYRGIMHGMRHAIDIVHFKE